VQSQSPIETGLPAKPKGGPMTGPANVRTQQVAPANPKQKSLEDDELEESYE